jgi:hypothetical protein
MFVMLPAWSLHCLAACLAYLLLRHAGEAAIVNRPGC